MNIFKLNKHITPSKVRQLEYKELKYQKNDEERFVKTIPLMRDNEKPVIIGVLTVCFPKKELLVDIYDNNRQLYAPYYNREGHFSHKPLVSKIDKMLNAEIDKLNAKTPYKKKVRQFNRQSR